MTQRSGCDRDRAIRRWPGRPATLRDTDRRPRRPARPSARERISSIRAAEFGCWAASPVSNAPPPKISPSHGRLAAASHVVEMSLSSRPTSRPSCPQRRAARPAERKIFRMSDQLLPSADRVVARARAEATTQRLVVVPKSRPTSRTSFTIRLAQLVDSGRARCQRRLLVPARRSCRPGRRPIGRRAMHASRLRRTLETVPHHAEPNGRRHSARAQHDPQGLFVRRLDADHQQKPAAEQADHGQQLIPAAQAPGSHRRSTSGRRPTGPSSVGTPYER